MLKRQIVTGSVVIGAVLLPVGAMADSVSVESTGAGSTQTVSFSNNVSATESNTSSVVVSSVNSQHTSSGDVTAADNTAVGTVASGGASNSNGNTSAVAVSDGASEVAVSPAGGQGGSAEGSTQGSSAGGAGVASGEVLGASTGGDKGGAVAMLPVTGPSIPVDVSAIRTAWHLGASAPTVGVARPVRNAMPLLLATLLGLLGGLGNVAYLRQKENRSER